LQLVFNNNCGLSDIRMGNANCRVHNDTQQQRTIHVFNYADGIRLIPRDTVTLKPGETRRVEALAHGSGLILATDTFKNGHHMAVGNGELTKISELDREPGNSWAVPLTVVAGVGIAAGAVVSPAHAGLAAGAALTTAKRV